MWVPQSLHKVFVDRLDLPATSSSHLGTQAADHQGNHHVGVDTFGSTSPAVCDWYSVTWYASDHESGQDSPCVPECTCLEAFIRTS